MHLSKRITEAVVRVSARLGPGCLIVSRGSKVHFLTTEWLWERKNHGWWHALLLKGIKEIEWLSQ